MHKKAWEKYVFPEEDYQALQNSIEDVSGFKPMIGIKLKLLVDGHRFSKKKRFDYSVKSSLDVYT